MRTLARLTVKNMEFKAFDMVHEDFDKIRQSLIEEYK